MQFVSWDTVKLNLEHCGWHLWLFLKGSCMPCVMKVFSFVSDTKSDYISAWRMSQFDSLLDFGESTPSETNGTTQGSGAADEFDPFGPSPTIESKGAVDGNLLVDFTADTEVSRLVFSLCKQIFTKINTLFTRWSLILGVPLISKEQGALFAYCMVTSRKRSSHGLAILVMNLCLLLLLLELVAYKCTGPTCTKRS